MNTAGAAQGVRVLVTRPRERAEGLVCALRAVGAVPIECPGVVLEPAEASLPEGALAGTEHFDLIVFASPAAVSHGTGLFDPGFWSGARIGAIGEATAMALRESGLPVDIQPEQGFDSEALLAMPELEASRVSGRRVLIVRGEGGRALLADTLRARGAEVCFAEVYRRARPAPAGSLSLPECDVLTITSKDIAVNLLAMIVPAQRGELLGLPVVVISQRIAHVLRELGFTDKIVVADGADNASITNGVCTLVASGRNTSE